MEAVERHARRYFFFDGPPSDRELTLHVEAGIDAVTSESNNSASAAAQQLYFGMGYRPVRDDRSDRTEFWLLSWLSPCSSKRRRDEGIYFCDGRPKLYMKKRLLN